MNPAVDSTVIGKSVTIRGEISGKEDLLIDGEIEGSITLSDSRLTVGPNARVLADVHVRDVVVFGNVHGNIHASGRIELRQSAIIAGDIFASRLSIEESAVIKGRVELSADRAEAPVTTLPVSPVPVATLPKPQASPHP